MSTHKGFINPLWLLAGLIIMVGAGVGYWYTQKTASQAENTTPVELPISEETALTQAEATVNAVVPVTQPPTEDWESYANDYLELAYPADMRFISNVCIKDCDSYHTNDTAASYVSAYVERDDDVSCHFGLCQKNAEKQLTFNDVTWDYLGEQMYGDAGHSSTFFAYRTTFGVYSYQILFSEESPRNEVIMQSVHLKTP